MNHPLPINTSVIVKYHGCRSCGIQKTQLIATQIVDVHDENGEYAYTLLDGRRVSQIDIVEVLNDY